MRSLLLLLLLPCAAIAAEPLEGKALEETFLPAGPECSGQDKQKKPENCPSDATEKAVRDAEEQASGQDPASKAIVPAEPPPIRQPPPDELTPAQRDLMQQIKNIPAQMSR